MGQLCPVAGGNHHVRIRICRRCRTRVLSGVRKDMGRSTRGTSRTAQTSKEQAASNHRQAKLGAGRMEVKENRANPTYRTPDAVTLRDYEPRTNDRGKLRCTERGPMLYVRSRVLMRGVTMLIRSQDQAQLLWIAKQFVTCRTARIYA